MFHAEFDNVAHVVGGKHVSSRIAGVNYAEGANVCALLLCRGEGAFKLRVLYKIEGMRMSNERAYRVHIAIAYAQRPATLLIEKVLDGSTLVQGKTGRVEWVLRNRDHHAHR